jgi:hypothetical protein
MHRPALLALTATALAGAAGCNADGHGGTDTTPTTEPTDSPRPRTEADATPTPRGSLQVELEHVKYGPMAYRVTESSGIAPDEIVPIEAVPSPFRAPLQAAVDGGYETDDVSKGMRAAIDEFRRYARTDIGPYVRIDGTSYEFDARVPTFVAWLADENAADPDPERVLGEDERRFDSDAVDAFVRSLRARGTHVFRNEYRACVVPAGVGECLDQYDYITDYKATSPIRTERRNTEPPFTVEVRPLTDEDLWGRPIVDGADLAPEVRSFLRTVIDSDHRSPAQLPNRSVYFADEVPSAALSLHDRWDEAQYYRIAGGVYGFGVGSSDYESVPVRVTVEEHPAADSNEAPAFTVTAIPDAEAANGPVATDGTFTFTGEGGLPSVLWVTHDGERIRLPSDAYERDKWRTVADAPSDDPRPVNEVLVVTDHGEPLAATYRIPDALPPGTYVSRGLFRVSWNIPGQTPGGHGSYPFRLRITLGAG